MPNESDARKIYGLRLSGYRSFGPELQTLAPFEKINIFVGQNHCGKSNILRFLYKHYPSIGRDSNNPAPYEHFGREKKELIDVEVGVPLDHPVLESFLATNGVGEYLVPALKESPFEFDEKGNILYVPYSFKTITSKKTLLERKRDQLVASFTRTRSEAWSQLIRKWKTASGNPSIGDPGVIKQVFDTLIKVLLEQHQFWPKIYHISEFRKIQSGQRPGQYPNNQIIIDGQGIIDDLVKLQNPGSTSITSSELIKNRDTFLAITTFFQEVVGDKNATLQVTSDQQQIIVDLNNRVDTLESLGTGFHQLMLIAIVATCFDGSVFCIEEPELNMHPALQKKLLDYLANNTNNQYFITTHSATLVDVSKNSSVFHVVHDDVQSHVRLAFSGHEQRKVTDDLGIRPSDLLQANCLIWVEGPSDRIYINKAIREFGGEDLRENEHYAFVLYGGSIRSNFALESDPSEETQEEQVDDTLIKILPLNQHAVMILDSDRTSATDRMGRGHEHKIRLQEEFAKVPDALYWPTEGCTIENYIKPEIFKDARKGVHRDTEFADDIESPFSDVYQLVSGSKYSSAKKVQIAKYIADLDEPFRQDTDIEKLTKALVEKILQWNGIQIPCTEVS